MVAVFSDVGVETGMSGGLDVKGRDKLQVLPVEEHNSRLRPNLEPPLIHLIS
jgi:hypothetical protein